MAKKILKKKIIIPVFAGMAVAALLATGVLDDHEAYEDTYVPPITETLSHPTVRTASPVADDEDPYDYVPYYTIYDDTEELEEPETVLASTDIRNWISISDYELQQLYDCVQGEVGYTSWYSCYLVASCVLNRALVNGSIYAALSEPLQFQIDGWYLYCDDYHIYNMAISEQAVDAVWAAIEDRDTYVYYFASYDAHSRYAPFYLWEAGSYFYGRY